MGTRRTIIHVAIAVPAIGVILIVAASPAPIVVDLLIASMPAPAMVAVLRMVMAPVVPFTITRIAAAWLCMNRAG